MMKKLAGLTVLFGIILALTAVCYAENRPVLYYNGNTYTIEQASSPNSGFPFEVQEKDGITAFSDKDTGLSASISFDTLDKASFDMLRQYYNDDQLTDDQLFSKYTDLQKSYIPALQDLYRMSYLYGDSGSPASESNMKLFHESSEKVFGENANVFLYNIIKSDKSTSNEVAHLDLFVPVPSTYSVISVNFLINGGSLNPDAIDKIADILGCLRFTGLPAQTETLRVFEDKKAVEASNAGIYPVRNIDAAESAILADVQAGFKLIYPATFVPYMQNSIGGSLTYKSFKITPNHLFSISSEPAGSALAAVEKAAFIKKGYEGSANVTFEGKVSIGNKDFTCLKYSLDTGGGQSFVQDYFIVYGPTLFTLQLNSRFEQPSAAITDAFERIIASLDLAGQIGAAAASGKPQVKYTNNEEGYGFSYPENWQLSDVSDDVSYDRLKLKLPELSGPIDITMAEGQLNPGSSPDGILPGLAGQAGPGLDKYFKHYAPPYAGTVQKPLSMSYAVKDSALYVYRLVNYMDANGRSRLCYSTDIIKGVKVYSMFITVGDYETIDGKISDSSIDGVVNEIASSFRLENTGEAAERQAKGETRNRKVVFIEESLKKLLGPQSTVTAVSKTDADGYVIATVEKIAESGYYKIKPDFVNRNIQVVEKNLKNEILAAEFVKLLPIYSKRQMENSKLDIDNMTITINSRESASTPAISSTYQVNVMVSAKGVQWETVRNNHANELKAACKAYLDSLLLTDVKLYFASESEFNGLESYTKTGSTYRTAVFTEFNNASGYFVLEIDPTVDSIRLLSFKPYETLLREIDDKFSFVENGFEIADSSFGTSKFITKLSLSSKAGAPASEQNVKIHFNPAANSLEYIKI